MATASLNEFLRRLTRGMAAETLLDQSDRQLVARALAGPDEAAFQAILRRHGAMVYRVCWRVAQNDHDAEDAFQATFLVLAQKLRTLRRHASLASWLHGVAHRVALKAKAQSAARRRQELQAARSDTRSPDDGTWAEMRRALDAALGGLPDKWRLPLILCYLEGQTQDEAACHLGWSKSTFRRRLAEARQVLRHRLLGSGFWPTALSVVLLSDCLASAAPAPGLVALTVEAAAGVASGARGAPAASAKIAALAEGVLQTMVLSRIKMVAAILVLGLLTLGGGLLCYGRTQAPPGQALQVAGPQPARAKQVPNPGKKPAKVTEEERARQLDTRGRILFAQFPCNTPITDQGGVGVVRWGEKKKATLLFERPDLRKGTPTAYRLSPDGKKVAYLVQVRAGEHDLVYVRSLDPAGPPEDMKVDGRHVSWSPDGKQLLVSRGQAGNVIVDLKTKKQTALELPPNHWALEWSPDGKSFLLRLETDKGTEQLAWMNRGDLKVQPLAGTEGSWDGRISPDGKHILFILPGAKTTSNLWVLNRQDGKTRKINQELNCSVRCASWSPSGRRLAYTLTRFDPDSPTRPFNQETESFVMVSDLEGKHQESVVSGRTSGISALDFTLWDWR
jgi:RNA polymerase sigma factor (sigma-70 family)